MKYVCGKCGSIGLYRDDDLAGKEIFIACRICGNRWPGGTEPVKVAVAGSGLQPEPLVDVSVQYKHEEKQGGKIMATHKQYLRPCVNCGRKLQHQGKGLCGGCRSVVQRTPPEQLEAALAAAKVRFNAPDFNGRAHKYRGRRSKLPAIPAAAGAPAPVIASEARQSCSTLAAAVKSLSADGPSLEAVVTLSFGDDRDRKLYAALLEQSFHLRRSIDQHILWIVQEALACGGRLENDDAKRR